MPDQLIKISQFECGLEVLQQLDNPINIYTDCNQLDIEHDGQSIFQTIMLPIPNNSIDWRTVKMTVNGNSFHEHQSFIREDNGTLKWINPLFKLQKEDIVFIEYTVDGSRDYPFDDLEEIDGLLYIIVQNYLVTVEHDGQRYPLVIDISSDGDISYYIIKDGVRQYYKVNSQGKFVEVGADIIGGDIVD